jgi:signal transduction histidine kinase
MKYSTLHALTGWQRSLWVLPIAAVMALSALLINESSYRSSSASLVSLGERATARVRIQSLLRNLIDAETGQRGYLLTAQDQYLAPYRSALGSVAESQMWLEEYYDKDPLAEALLAAMRADTTRKLGELAQTLALSQQGQHDAWRALVMSNEGKQVMDRIRDNTLSLLALESDRVTRQRAELLNTLLMGRIGLATMVALSLLALAMYLRQSAHLAATQRQHAADLRHQRDHLEVEVANRTEELTHLAENLQTAREDERGHIARELHDELGALLTAAKLDAARLKRSLVPVNNPDIDERLSSLTQTLNDGIGLKRRIIEDLRPSSLSNLGVKAAIEILTKGMAQRANLTITTQIDPFDVDQATGITLYRMVQESITNVIKYAKATQVTVLVRRDGPQIHASVTDNGCGFEPKAVHGSAHGLVGMRYRVQARGGRLQVRSATGQGTTVTAVLPMAMATPSPKPSPTPISAPSLETPQPPQPHHAASSHGVNPPS